MIPTLSLSISINSIVFSNELSIELYEWESFQFLDSVHLKLIKLCLRIYL